MRASSGCLSKEMTAAAMAAGSFWGTMVPVLPCSIILPISPVPVLTIGMPDAMASKVADFFEQEVDDAVDNLSALMEPAIMAILGILVGGLVVAMYLPIFKMGAVV